MKGAGPARSAWILVLLVCAINAAMGTLVAFVLVRDRFPGKRLLELIIDVPFALPTIVAGLVLLSLYGPGSPIGVEVNNTRWAVFLAMAFVISSPEMPPAFALARTGPSRICALAGPAAASSPATTPRVATDRLRVMLSIGGFPSGWGWCRQVRPRARGSGWTHAPT